MLTHVNSNGRQCKTQVGQVSSAYTIGIGTREVQTICFARWHHDSEDEEGKLWVCRSSPLLMEGFVGHIH
jgi:hypothetical protein